MTQMTLQELESTAWNYERMLVPAIFEKWAHQIANAARVQAGQRVLDVACGTGVLARAISRGVKEIGSVDGLDINPAMLSAARQAAPEIEWRQGEAESLPYPDESFDIVVSQFGLMFFVDRVAALRQMMRVLAPGGRLTVAVFHSLNEIPAYSDMVAVLDRAVGDGAAQALRSPFALGDTEELISLFHEAGIEWATVSSHSGSESYPSVKDMVLANTEGWFPLAGIRLDEATLQALIAASEKTMKPYVLPNGAVEFQTGAHIVTATKDRHTSGLG